MGGVVLVAPRFPEVAVGDSVLLTAKRLSHIASCYPNAGRSFQWEAQEPTLVRITPLGDSTAFVTGLGVGSFLVYATLDGGEVPGPLTAASLLTIQ